MAILHVFKSRIPSCKFLFKNGKEANFIGGRFMTDVQSEIDELQAEVTLNHPHIYVDSAEAKVDSEKLDPLEEIRKKAVADYLAKQAAAVATSNDRGSTAQGGKLEGIANSATIASGAAGSSSGAAATK